MANSKRVYQKIANLRIMSDRYISAPNSDENSPMLYKASMPYLCESSRKHNASHIRLNSNSNCSTARSCSPQNYTEFKSSASRRSESRRNLSGFHREESVFSNSSRANIPRSSSKVPVNLELKCALRYSDLINSSTVKNSQAFIASSQQMLNRMYKELREIAKIDQDERHHARLKRWRKQRFQACNSEDFHNSEKASFGSFKRAKDSFGM